MYGLILMYHYNYQKCVLSTVWTVLRPVFLINFIDVNKDLGYYIKCVQFKWFYRL